MRQRTVIGLIILFISFCALPARAQFLNTTGQTSSWEEKVQSVLDNECRSMTMENSYDLGLLMAGDPGYDGKTEQCRRLAKDIDLKGGPDCKEDRKEATVSYAECLRKLSEQN